MKDNGNQLVLTTSKVKDAIGKGNIEVHPKSLPLAVCV